MRSSCRSSSTTLADAEAALLSFIRTHSDCRPRSVVLGGACVYTDKAFLESYTMKKIDPEAPHEVMLVLDAGTGQNAINQTKQFLQWVGVSGLTLTKLDGTAKGGIVFALAKQFGLPVRFIGVGEGIDDLRPFNADEFTRALFARSDDD